MPVLERYLPGIAPVDDAGIVHRDVQLPEPLDGSGGDALDILGVSYIGGHREHVGTVVGQSRRVRPEILLVDIGHDHTHPGGDEGFDDGQPDAAGRTGDDGGPSFQLLHGQAMVPEGARGTAPSVPTLRSVGDDGAACRCAVVDSAARAAGGWDSLRSALPGRKVDEQGELLSVPLPLNFVWLVLGVLMVLEALNDIFGVAGPDWLYDNWVHHVILGAGAALVLARAAFEPVARKAWMAFGIGLLLWFIGSAAWTWPTPATEPALSRRSRTRSGWRGTR